MSSEALSQDQAIAWYQFQDQPGDAAGWSDPAEAQFREGDHGEDWPVPIATPPQLIPRVFPGL
jgi:hypothetical protein